MEDLLLKICEIGKAYQISKVILFGSRGRGDNTEKSDYDICFVASNLTHQIKSEILDAIEEIDSFHKIDVVFLKDLSGNDDLTLNIKKDGKMLMHKFETKLNNFRNALNKLKDGLADYETSNLETIRDGIIQRFEFTTELAWKTVREYLIEEGLTDINTPKSVMKEAFSAGLIEDEQGWIQILNDRNATSHIYDETEAAEIFERIQTKYVILFQRLLEKF